MASHTWATHLPMLIKTTYVSVPLLTERVVIVKISRGHKRNVCSTYK